MSEEELRKKIANLEAQLKAVKRPKEYTVREDEYKGHPLLVFEGPSLIRPLSLGVGKLKAIHACREQVTKFIAKHDSAKLAEAKSGDNTSGGPVTI